MRDFYIVTFLKVCYRTVRADNKADAVRIVKNSEKKVKKIISVISEYEADLNDK